MRRRLVFFEPLFSLTAATVLCIVAVGGCGDSAAPDDCAAGTAGCVCAVDESCGPGLVCLSQVCVGDSEPPDAFDADVADVGLDAGDAGDTDMDSDAMVPAVTCSELDPPADGSVMLEGVMVGDVASYGCDPGLGLVGVASRTCTMDGEWTAEAPTCAPADCPGLMSPSDGTVTTPDGAAVGADAIYACNEGYDLSGGDATRGCQADGTWTGSEPSCEPVDCGALTAPEDGTVDTADGTTFGQVASYGCVGGHELVGGASRTCGADGAWSETAPTCEPVDCGALTAPEDGTVDTSDGTTFGQVADYGCTGGYGLVGFASRTCGADGAWSETAPTCAPGDCSNLMSPTNGTVETPSGTVFGAMANYECASGYDLTGGNATRTCEAGPMWSGTAPSCLPVDCGGLGDPDDGSVATLGGTTYGETASYSCDTGYDLVGAGSRTCQANGTWSGSAPSCQIVDCGGLSDPDDGSVATLGGTTYDQTASYSCDLGHNRVGSQTRVCLASGSWSGTAPTCAIVDCGQPSEPDDGSVSTPDGTTYDEVATFDCDPGYFAVGNTTATCTQTGAWSNGPPSCNDAHTEGLRLTQVHVGSSEFVRIENTGASVATLIGAQVEFHDPLGTDVYEFTGGTLGAGSSTTVGESSSYPITLDLSGARAATILLCSGSPCDASTVIDAVVFEGGGTAPNLPPGVGFDVPLWGIDAGNDDDEDFYRVATTGGAGNFTNCDWTAAGAAPLFVESFECGLSSWITDGNTLTTGTSNPSSDGSPRSAAVTSVDANGIRSVLPSPAFPTYIDYWTQFTGVNGTAQVAMCYDAGCSTDGLLISYWAGPNMLCAGDRALSTGVCASDLEVSSWAHVEFYDINWNTGEATVRITGEPASGTGTASADIFISSGRISGLHTVLLSTTGAWDGFRMW